MKIIESWLREWIDIPQSIEQIAQQLTMAGLEVAEINRSGLDFSDVVVGEVLEVAQHPDAERLHVCKVNIGMAAVAGEGNATLTIVCGASNVRQGLKVPVALCGATLPGNIKIKKTKLRGVESSGMLCSAKELNLATDATGLLELPADAPIGVNIAAYLKLNDAVVEVELTANRGDCLSVLGVARELAAINNLPKPLAKLEEIKKLTTASFPACAIPITLVEPKICPNYAGCVIKNINNKNKTPKWMIDRLEKSGLNSINPVVDVANYVMLELGQPLHAFDLNKIDGGIVVRYAKPQEKIVTLDNRELELTPDILVIADNNKALALAGIIGGFESAVTADTSDIFLESAYFDTEKIRKTAQHFSLMTDAAYRFERGVDPCLQVLAAALTRKLLLEIVGGQAYAIINSQDLEYLPKPKTISLSIAKTNKVLGVTIDSKKIINIFNALDMGIDVQDEVDDKKSGDKIVVFVPAYRFDINIEEDLIEEVARIYGYDELPSKAIVAALSIKGKNERANIRERGLKSFFVGRGYCEAITYSFVSPRLQNLLDPKCLPQMLVNPIAVEQSAMRTSLWPGLVAAMQYNLQRQQDRIRFFEIGLCFRKDREDVELQQKKMLAGIILGKVLPLQWDNLEERNIDFYDIKHDIESLLYNLGYKYVDVLFKAEEHPALHPKRCAAVYVHGMLLGYVGELHPALRGELEIKQNTYVFELDLEVLQHRLFPMATTVSKFPRVERDLAIIANQNVLWSEIEQKIKETCSKLLQHVKIFDIYCGEGIAPGKKSMALRFNFQSMDRTLTDIEIDKYIEKIVKILEKDLEVTLRG